MIELVLIFFLIKDGDTSPSTSVNSSSQIFIKKEQQKKKKLWILYLIKTTENHPSFLLHIKTELLLNKNDPHIPSINTKISLFHTYTQKYTEYRKYKQ